MNKELELNLKKFKITTINIMEALKDEKYDELDLLFSARQMLIDKIDQLKYDKSDFQNISNTFNLQELEQELTKAMHEKRTSILKNLAQLNQNKHANNSYVKKSMGNPTFFNKEI